MGITALVLGGKACALEEVGAALMRRTIERAVDFDRLLDDVLDGHPRIERCPEW